MQLTIPITSSPFDTQTYTRRINLDIPCPSNFPECPCLATYCPKYKIPFIDTDIFYFYVGNKPDTITSINLETNLPILPNPASFIGNRVTVDFSLLPIDICSFYVKFTSNSVDYCFEFSFVRVELKDKKCTSPTNYDCGKDTVLIKSTYNSRDCLGNRYSSSYSNQIRIFGFTEFIGTTRNEEMTEKKKLIRRLVQENYKLRTNEILDNSWLLTHLSKSVFLGDNLTIDDMVLLLDSDISKTKEDLPFWFLDVNLKTVPCVINYSCD